MIRATAGGEGFYDFLSDDDLDRHRQQLMQFFLGTPGVTPEDIETILRYEFSEAMRRLAERGCFLREELR